MDPIKLRFGALRTLLITVLHDKCCIFELSKSERESRLKSALNEVIQLTIHMQKPFVYRDNLRIQPNFFIHQYPNGKKFLILQNQENSKESVLRELA